jgi:hypothetical protein
VLTWLQTDEYNSKIRPQSMEPGSFSIPTENKQTDDPVQNVDPDPLDGEE